MNLVFLSRLAFITLTVLIVSSCGGGGGASQTAGVEGTTAGNSKISPPSSPVNVIATPGTAQVTISWAPASGATTYNLYWSTATGVTPSSGNRIENVTSPYLHSGLSGRQTYHYVVTAVNAAGESAASEQVSATPAVLGSTWTTRVPGYETTERYHSDITWGPKGYVAVSNDSAHNIIIYTSADGINWVLRPVNGVRGLMKTVIWNGTEYLAGGMVVVGQNWAGYPLYAPDFLVSSDGVTWSRRRVTWDGESPVTENYGEQINSIASSGNVLVAIRNGVVFRSVDGIAWTSLGHAGVFRVVWNQDQFVMLVNGLMFEDDILRCGVLTSLDGLTWTPRFSYSTGNITTSSLDDVIWTGTQFVFAGRQGRNGLPEWGVLGHYNPFTDESGAAPWESGQKTLLARVMWDGQQFAAIGTRTAPGASAPVDAVLTSPDGRIWAESYFGTTFHNLQGIAASPFGYAAIGSDGAIITSP